MQCFVDINEDKLIVSCSSGSKNREQMNTEPIRSLTMIIFHTRDENLCEGKR